jgi:O-methyltransferase
VSADLYLELLKRALTGMIYEDPAISVAWRPESVYDAKRRQAGKDWPLRAHTMIGMTRLNNLQYCIEEVLGDNVPGDFIETGVWRGGACIFMRGVLEAYYARDRTVWMADSFCGFPPSFGLDREDDIALASQPDQEYLSVTLKEVVRNFQHYGLMDHQVKVIVGWFENTLPGPIKRLSILRLDSDLYKSTMDSIVPLYPRLMPGGFCIVDDWNVPMCREAICEYRDSRGITEPIHPIDEHSVYWRKVQ